MQRHLGLHRPTISRRLTGPLTTIALLLAGPEAAHAAGYFTLERGPSNYGRGGADTAAPNDPSALYTNPSALAGLRGLQLLVDENATIDPRSFSRQSDAYAPSGGYPTARTTPAPFPGSPGFFATYNFAHLGLEHLTLGAGAYGPPRSDREWTDGGTGPQPQRYGELRSDDLLIHYELAAAYELPWAKLRIGAAAMAVEMILDTNLALSSGLGSGPEDPRYDVVLHTHGQHDTVPSGIFSVSAAPLPWLVVAVTYQLAYNIVAKGGQVDVTPGAEIQRLVEQGDINPPTHGDLALHLRMPDVLRAAVKVVDPKKRFDVELDFVWEDWSRNQQLSFVPKNMDFTSSNPFYNIHVGTVTYPMHWRNAYSFRLGGHYQVTDAFALRAGIYYERSAVPTQWLNPMSFDLDKIGGAVGARIDMPWHLWLDLAAGYTYWLPQTVTNSQFDLINPITNTPMQPAHSIGNGTYRNGSALVMAALGAHFDL